MEKEIKELRIKIDGLAQLTNSLTPKAYYLLDVAYIPAAWDLEKVLAVFDTTGKFIVDSGSKDITKDVFIPVDKTNKEVQKAVDSLYLAKAWLGKVLQEIGTINPYKSGYKTKEDIEPTADTHKGIKHLEEKGNWNTDFNHIQKVDYLRTEIENLIKSDYISSMTYQPKSRLEAVARTNTYNYLCEAKFQLGFELARIKEEK